MQTTYLKIDRENIDDTAVKTAAEILCRGGLVCFPTETVYGLGANGLDENAVASIFRAKGRPQDNPLILHLASVDALTDVAVDIPNSAYDLFEKYAPGPLTLVLKRAQRVPKAVSAGLDTVAVRIPSHPIAHALIKAAGVPVAAPSANLSGKPSPTAFEHVKDELFGRADVIIDGGECDVGVESTVLSLAGDKPILLRPGGITIEQIEAVIGKIDISSAVYQKFDGTAAAPGMKYRHYAPKAHLTVVTGNDMGVIRHINQKPKEKAGVLCFDGEEKYFDGFDTVIAYGAKDDKNALAHNLFDALRKFDNCDVEHIYARICDDEGVGLAVCNRLNKAAGFDIEKAQKVTLIGVTGRSGSGKTTALKYMQSVGVNIVDGDKVSRQLYEKGTALYHELVRLFGEKILQEGGEIDRGALAKIVFSDQNKLKLLNKTAHRYILPEIVRQVIQAPQNVSAVEGAALIESGFWSMCDTRLVLTTSKSKERIIERDGLSEEAAEMRLAAQKEEAYYVRTATHVIANNGKLTVLYKKLDALLSEVRK